MNLHFSWVLQIFWCQIIYANQIFKQKQNIYIVINLLYKNMYLYARCKEKAKAKTKAQYYYKLKLLGVECPKDMPWKAAQFKEIIAGGRI